MYFRLIRAASASALAVAITVQPVLAQSSNARRVEAINLDFAACIGPTGQFRIVRETEACRPSERRFTLPGGGSGSQGPAGPAGPQGPAGPAGAQGAAGPPGETGAAGPAGPQGEAGVAGPAGPTGEAGAMGPMGPAGLQGAIGPQGPAGLAGADGALGPAGPAGANGAAGAVGPQGEMGPAGPAGPAGADGGAGPAGPAGADGAPGERGADGAQGPAGPPGPSGAGFRGQTSWMARFEFTDQLQWVTIPGSSLVFESNGGPLVINVDMYIYSLTFQTFSCRPMIDGQWAGAFGGYTYSDRWTEGLYSAKETWAPWTKVRVYQGIPAGGHILTMECLKDGMGFMWSGYESVPQSLSVLEMN